MGQIGPGACTRRTPRDVRRDNWRGGRAEPPGPLRQAALHSGLVYGNERGAAAGPVQRAGGNSEVPVIRRASKARPTWATRGTSRGSSRELRAARRETLLEESRQNPSIHILERRFARAVVAAAEHRDLVRDS